MKKNLYDLGAGKDSQYSLRYIATKKKSLCKPYEVLAQNVCALYGEKIIVIDCLY